MKFAETLGHYWETKVYGGKKYIVILPYGREEVQKLSYNSYDEMTEDVEKAFDGEYDVEFSEDIHQKSEVDHIKNGIIYGTEI